MSGFFPQAKLSEQWNENVKKSPGVEDLSSPETELCSVTTSVKGPVATRFPEHVKQTKPTYLPHSHMVELWG